MLSQQMRAGRHAKQIISHRSTHILLQERFHLVTCMLGMALPEVFFCPLVSPGEYDTRNYRGLQ